MLEAEMGGKEREKVNRLLLFPLIPPGRREGGPVYHPDRGERVKDPFKTLVNQRGGGRGRRD